MNTAAAMLDTYPLDVDTVDRATLVACIEACAECTQTCTACADACLAEDHVTDLIACIRANLDCADVCQATERVVTRQTNPDTQLTRKNVAGVRSRLLRVWRPLRPARRHA